MVKWESFGGGSRYDSRAWENELMVRLEVVGCRKTDDG